MFNKNQSKTEEDTGDIVYDDDVVETPKEIKKIKEQLKVCQEEKQQYLDGWQRSKADLINSKKRFDEEKKSVVNYALEGFVLEILPIVDSFEMAFKNKEAWEKNPEEWRKGIEFIYNQMVGVLKNNGIEVMEPLGEEFDPKLHHSVAMVPVTEESEDNKILEITQKGYKLNDKIIRYPNVKVGSIES